MSRKFYYLRDDQVRKVVATWWARLHGIDNKSAAPQQANQRGARAELRRSKSLDAVLLTEGFRNLWQALLETGQCRERDMLAWACVAAALAEVRQQPTNESATFAQCLGEQKERTGRPYMSELRFAQLQKSRSGDDFLMRVRRALALINKTAPVLSLADNIMHWFHEQRDNQSAPPTDRLAVRWATDYFTAVSAYEKQTHS